MSAGLIKKFIDLLSKLNKLEIEKFSGIGLVLYQSLAEINDYHCNLVNDVDEVPALKLGSNELTQYLSEISSYQHPYHDGFHFIDSTGTLTHIAQFFSPPIDKTIANLKGQGSRTLCSIYGSTINGILTIGTISSQKEIYLFNRGKVSKDPVQIKIEEVFTLS